MEGALEGDHRGTAGREPRELDRVLDRLVPALKKAALAGTVNGARASRRSASSTYGSYGTTVKSVG